MKRKSIDLMRHGQPSLTGVYLGHTDCQLSSIGQASALRAVSEEGDWDLIVSSPLQRCLETAQWLAEESKLELLVLPEMQEFDFGDWDGQPFEKVYAEDQEQASNFWHSPQLFPPPNGETVEAFRARVNKGLQKVLQHSCEKPLIITHGGVVRALVAEILGVDASNWSKISIDYAHFTQLRFDCDGEQCWSQLVCSNIKHPQR